MARTNPPEVLADAEMQVDCLVNSRKWFRSSVGRPKSMEAAASAKAQNRASSVNAAHRQFAKI